MVETGVLVYELRQCCCGVVEGHTECDLFRRIDVVKEVSEHCRIDLNGRIHRLEVGVDASRSMQRVLFVRTELRTLESVPVVDAVDSGVGLLSIGSGVTTLIRSLDFEVGAHPGSDAFDRLAEDRPRVQVLRSGVRSETADVGLEEHAQECTENRQ